MLKEERVQESILPCLPMEARTWRQGKSVGDLGDRACPDLKPECRRIRRHSWALWLPRDYWRRDATALSLMLLSMSDITSSFHRMACRCQSPSFWKYRIA
jgi:hypothetical protein